ncbi:MAG: IclR family transcriptional regulator [Acidobacteriota bacterium]
MAHSKRGSKPKYTVPAVEKSFAILEMFAARNQGYTLSEVGRLLKLPISTASSLLYTLQSCGYLYRNDKGRFFLTMKMLTEGNKALGQMKLREIAEPELKKLTLETGLASILSIRDGDQAVCIEKIEGTSPIRLASHVGKRMYLHQTSYGKAILAHTSEQQVEAIVESRGLPPATENTITSLPQLTKELTRIRAQGWALDDQETGLGIRGIAAPIFDHNGNVVAGVAVGGSVFELDKNLKAVATAVKACALRISEHLGYQETALSRSFHQA